MRHKHYANAPRRYVKRVGLKNKSRLQLFEFHADIKTNLPFTAFAEISKFSISMYGSYQIVTGLTEKTALRGELIVRKRKTGGKELLL
jgi:hypothetical protein